MKSNFIFKKASKYKLLTKEEERELFDLYKRGDTKARDKLILSNLRLAISIAHQYKNRNVLFDDIVSAAIEGLFYSCKGYDHTRGRFSTYAFPRIRAKIFAMLEENSIIRVPHGVYALKNKEKLKKNEQRRLDKAKKVWEGIRSANIQNETRENETSNFDMSVLKMAIENLEENEKRLINALFYEDKTLDEAATLKLFSDKILTRERIRQINVRVLGKLKSFIESHQKKE